MPAPRNFNTCSQDQSAVAAKANWLVCAFVLLLFVAAATLSAIRKDVTLGFDEVAHASYVAHLQHSGETWPAFEDMRMLDPSSFGFAGEANYLDHPRRIMCCWPALVPSWKAIPRRSSSIGCSMWCWSRSGSRP